MKKKEEKEKDLGTSFWNDWHPPPPPPPPLLTLSGSAAD